MPDTNQYMNRYCPPNCPHLEPKEPDKPPYVDHVCELYTVVLRHRHHPHVLRYSKCDYEEPNANIPTT